mmetsp:Transcript_10899/g.12471  ORF Transcript_10899/g.12471 Transcript_10899/m.12471 type:complete len:87 (-) Transcript_10899:75-335(-)
MVKKVFSSSSSLLQDFLLLFGSDGFSFANWTFTISCSNLVSDGDGGREDGDGGSEDSDGGSEDSDGCLREDNDGISNDEDMVERLL